MASSAGKFSRPRRNPVRLLGLVAVVLTIVCAGASFGILMGLTPIEPNEAVVRMALSVNGILAALLLGLIVYEFYRIWTARAEENAAARLHIRIVRLFAVIAVAPAFLVAIVASYTLDQGLDRWFSNRTQAIVSTSLSVADAYLQEHTRAINNSMLSLASEVNRARFSFQNNRRRFVSFFTVQSSIRGLQRAQIINENGDVIVQANLRGGSEVPAVPTLALGDAKEGRPILIAPGKTNLVGGVMQMPQLDEKLYLYVVKAIDSRVTNYLQLARDNSSDYARLNQSRFGFQLAFGLLYIGIAFVVLLAAIWVAIGMADSLVDPIRRLIGAAGEVSRGNLDVRVPVNRKQGDLAALGDTFNQMTGQLRSQRDDLMDASMLNEERRRFTEAVLTGVSAGVLGLDGDGRITIANRTALKILDLSAEDYLGKPLGELVPQFKSIVSKARRFVKREQREQITLQQDGQDRVLNVRINNDRPEDPKHDHGFVVTIDDISDLIVAQRSSAWADVARRIAHEIKNPLTPIQLSAERLRRKYGKVITEDREVFEQCTDTIVRQVGDIGRMVDEFSSFARMPKAMLERADLMEPLKQAVFLMDVGNPDIEITLESEQDTLIAEFDQRLMSQAFTNLIKNATEAINAVPSEHRSDGKITVRVTAATSGQTAQIDIQDNGKGLPKSDRHLLLEPYMTTREKGTGLGLAIVRKIMEDHGGRIELLDAPKDENGRIGAIVRLTMPVPREQDKKPDEQEKA